MLLKADIIDTRGSGNIWEQSAFFFMDPSHSGNTWQQHAFFIHTDNCPSHPWGGLFTTAPSVQNAIFFLLRIYFENR